MLKEGILLSGETDSSDEIGLRGLRTDFNRQTNTGGAESPARQSRLVQAAD
jgi:hypothetical protein